MSVSVMTTGHLKTGIESASNTSSISDLLQTVYNIQHIHTIIEGILNMECVIFVHSYFYMAVLYIFVYRKLQRHQAV
jgi:hypothetical protein